MTAVLSSLVPLAERRGVNLITRIPSPPYKINNGAGPALSNLPRRKRTAPRPMMSVHNEVKRQEEKKGKEDRCWSEVVPNIFVAFQGDGDQKVMVVERGRKYTHVITLSLAHAAGVQETSTDLPDGSSVRALHLSVCFPKKRASRAGLGLSLDQLKSTTAFLAESFASGTSPRILVTCPHERQTDAMSIIVTYLSKSLEEDVVEVLKVIDMIDALDSVWKGEVNEDEVDVIRTVLKELEK